jgi:hypothetical protein
MGHRNCIVAIATCSDNYIHHLPSQQHLGFMCRKHSRSSVRDCELVKAIPSMRTQNSHSQCCCIEISTTNWIGTWVAWPTRSYIARVPLKLFPSPPYLNYLSKRQLCTFFQVPIELHDYLDYHSRRLTRGRGRVIAEL